MGGPPRGPEPGQAEGEGHVLRDGDGGGAGEVAAVDEGDVERFELRVEVLCAKLLGLRDELPKRAECCSKTGRV